MSDLLVTIGSSAAVSTALSGGLVWLLKNWISERLKNAIQHEYDAKLETHKAQLAAALDSYKSELDAKNSATIERLRAELQIAAAEHQVRFARLHEKAAETIAETYALLYQLTVAVERYVSVFERSGGPSKEERRMAVADAMKNLADFFRPRRLYLPKDLADRIRAFEDKLFELAQEFMVGVEEGGDERYPDRDTWAKVDKAMRAEARPLFDALEDEFRTLLGVRGGAKVPQDR